MNLSKGGRGSRVRSSLQLSDPYNMKTRYATFIIVLLTLFVTILPLFAAVDPSIPEIVLQIGDSEIIECQDATRTAIGDPLVADVVALSTSEILLNAKSPGKTVLYIWDKAGRRLYRVTVKPRELDLVGICNRITDELNDPRITVRGVGSTILLEGIVSREAESSRAQAIAQAVVETMVFQGTTAGSTTQENKTVGRPEGDSFVLEKVVTDKGTTLTAETGLRIPRVVNLIQVEKTIDEVTVLTMATAASLRQALNDPALTVRALPGSVVLIEGNVGTPAEIARIDLLGKGYDKELGDTGKGMNDMSNATKETVTIVNMVKLNSSVARQIMVRAQVVDINKDAAKDFGIDWGRVQFETSDIPGVAASATVQDQPWLIGQSNFGPMDLFGGGAIRRFDPIGARIRALQTQNKAKVLSEPNLLVLDGREASMLVGGEIPIPIAQSGTTGAAAAITVEYKEFGVRLKILPEITSDNTLQIKVMPEVSSLDFANAVTVNGFQIPALRTRRAETTVNIKDGQSLIIGGLLSNDTAKLVKKIPLLGDLPIIGELFTSRSFLNSESELVIIITPQILRPTAQAEAEG